MWIWIFISKKFDLQNYRLSRQSLSSVTFQILLRAILINYEHLRYSFVII